MILINPQIINTHVHRFNHNKSRGFRVPSTIEIHSGLIPLHTSDIANPSILSKPRLCDG